MYNLAIFALRPKTRRVGAAANFSESQDVFVEGERAIEIANLQSHSAEVHGFGQPVTLGPNSVLGGVRLNLAGSHLTLRFKLSAANATPPRSQFRPCARARRS